MITSCDVSSVVAHLLTRLALQAHVCTWEANSPKNSYSPLCDVGINKQNVLHHLWYLVSCTLFVNMILFVNIGNFLK
jgi:hypothetical protein